MVRLPFFQDLEFGSEVADIHSIFDARAAKPRKRIRIALIGNFAPRKCGIATFTTDVVEKLAEFHPEISVDVHALDDPECPLPYENIASTIARNDPEDYARAARRINEDAVDVVWLQHEYGIFGGPDGEMVVEFVDRLAAPLVLTLHTVLGEPSERQRSILRHLVTRASRIMVMSHHSRDLLVSTYGAPGDILEVIDHGAPDRPFGRQDEFKAKLGLSGRKVLMTFGLLGPGKGLEHAIRSLPAIAVRHPEVLYRIVGATHPNLVAEEGEAYREQLMVLAASLGVVDHIAWDNRFLDTPELLDQLEACDIYLTPYPGLEQSASGTLSYAVALGKAVVSTPYVHARELLAQDVGRLIPPRSSEAIAEAVNSLLDAPEAMAAMQRRAYGRGRATIWPRFADASARLVAQAAARKRTTPPVTAMPSLAAVLAMSDATGMLQHSIGVVPDRRHGYCLDDNARALMLMNLVQGLSTAERMKWTLAYAAFVQSARNPDLGRFRNFMRFDRSWCEDEGSEDSNGRAVWALGETYARAGDAGVAEWALHLYEDVTRSMATLGSPGAIAFAMLGACAVLRRDPGHQASRETASRGGEILMRLLGAGRRPDWAWFEAVLGYDNPRLPQALIEAGTLLSQEQWTGAGLETLEWICAQQVSAKRQFRPIGSESFHMEHSYLPFDQQPLEARAAIEAAGSALRATGNPFWHEHAMTAWRWFFGDNDRGVVLADVATGRCRDGVTPRGANANCGAESLLAFQLSYYALMEMLPLSAPFREKEECLNRPENVWSDPLRIFETRLHADPARVVIRPFHLGWQAKNAPGGRALALVQDITALTEQRAALEYERVLRDFKERHWHTEKIFACRFDEVANNLGLEPAQFSQTKQRLIGSYFCHEYTFAAAALMNPSIVPSPDQSGLDGRCVRFIMSLRAVGEGHISSIAFREGIAECNGDFQLWPQAAFATSVELDEEDQVDADCSVSVHRHSESSLSNTVIFPITEQQRGGLEDLRLVRFDHGGGDFEWIGTYTAYSGSSIRSELLRTRDFQQFDLEPIRGAAGRNKGMALFPEKIGGRFAMVGRQDGKNLFLLKSDTIDTWDDEGVLLMEPKYPWEFIQIGNCGSPIPVDEGWLMFTHGVGAMRKYALGCALLDRDDPSKVLARTPEPVLTAENADRSGYVPNVIYTCGALKVEDRLLIPYGISDSTVGFATCTIDALLAMME